MSEKKLILISLASSWLYLTYQEIVIGSLEHRNHEVRSSVHVSTESLLQQQPVPFALRRGAVPGMHSAILLQNILQSFIGF